jgi:hypothetical protein
MQEEEKKRAATEMKDVEMKGRRDSFLADSPPTLLASLHIPKSDTRELRKIQSERRLHGSTVTIGIDEVLHAEPPIHPESPLKEIRRCKSEQQLPRA